MVVTIITKKIQQEQEKNAESNIPVKSKRQGLVLSITACPVIIFSLEHIINPSTHENKNMRALYIQQSLVVH